MRPFFVESLEERVLLSHGLDDVGLSADQRSSGNRAGSLPAPQVVQMDIAKLAAEGINVPAQAGGVQDGRVSVLRFDKYYLIGEQFYQYASGPGYPLVPVAGPALRGDIGVQHGPIPVLLPQQEPAFAAIPTSPAYASPTPAAPASPPLADAPGTSAVVTTPSASATPEIGSGAGIVAITQSQVPTTAAAAVPVPVPNTASAGISSPSTSTTATALANILREGIGAIAASMANLLSSAATPQVVMANLLSSAATPQAVTGTLDPLAAAPVATTVPTMTADSARDEIRANVAPVTAPPSSMQSLALTDMPGMVAAGPTTAAPAATPAPVSTAAIPDGVSRTSPLGGGLEPTLAPAASGDGRVLDGVLRGEEGGSPLPTRVDTSGTWALVPTGVPVDPGTFAINRPVPTFAEEMSGEVVDSIDLGAIGRGGTVEEADIDAEGDGESVNGLIPFAIASVTGLAWGNYVFTARIADRHRQRESESPETGKSSAGMGRHTRWSRRLGKGPRLVEANTQA